MTVLFVNIVLAFPTFRAHLASDVIGVTSAPLSILVFVQDLNNANVTMSLFQWQNILDPTAKLPIFIS